MNSLSNAPLALYYLPLPEKDRWIPGDRYFRKIIRNIVRGRPRPGGVDMVFINLCKGLDRIGIPYEVNKPFSKLHPEQVVAVLGRGRECLQGYHQENSIIAGIGLMTHPAEWPDLCKKYPVKRYLQHSNWCNNLYIPYFGAEICQDIWPVGIDTEIWKPNDRSKTIDFLVYNKIHWDKQHFYEELVQPIKQILAQKGYSIYEIEYGRYKRKSYKELLQSSRAMIFLAEHESQGLAYQEALSMNIPILAWNPGKIMDPQYKVWGDYGKPASSVPYWNEYCGEVFTSMEGFNQQLEVFLRKLDKGFYQPRNYIEQNLSLKGCAQMFLNIVEKVAIENDEIRSQQP